MDRVNICANCNQEGHNAENCPHDDPSGRSAADQSEKHRKIIGRAVSLGLSNGLDVAATTGNDSNGDISVAEEDLAAFLNLIGQTIDGHRGEEE